jgi:protein subunit release factor B
MLRSETGIHRLVRKSPFDSNARRHTSFCSVTAYPEIDDSFEVDINPADLRIDTYRASGAGGQHINKTDSAVRITHLPTNIVVQCQNDRSQHRNRAEAMAMLKSRIYEAEMRKRQAEQQKLEDAKSDIGWGHQIRSYVLDQSRIKDLRTNVEVGNTQGVLDGDLDQFIEASLKQGVSASTMTRLLAALAGMLLIVMLAAGGTVDCCTRQQTAGRAQRNYFPDGRRFCALAIKEQRPAPFAIRRCAARGHSRGTD